MISASHQLRFRIWRFEVKEEAVRCIRGRHPSMQKINWWFFSSRFDPESRGARQATKQRSPGENLLLCAHVVNRSDHGAGRQSQDGTVHQGKRSSSSDPTSQRWRNYFRIHGRVWKISSLKYVVERQVYSSATFQVNDEGNWEHWNERVPKYNYPSDSVPDYMGILVPNVDNVRTDFIMHTIMKQVCSLDFPDSLLFFINIITTWNSWFQVKRHLLGFNQKLTLFHKIQQTFVTSCPTTLHNVQEKSLLLIGEQGTAKTVMIKGYAKRYDPERQLFKALNFSSATTPNMFQVRKYFSVQDAFHI